MRAGELPQRQPRTEALHELPESRLAPVGDLGAEVLLDRLRSSEAEGMCLVRDLSPATVDLEDVHGGLKSTKSLEVEVGRDLHLGGENLCSSLQLL